MRKNTHVLLFYDNVTLYTTSTRLLFSLLYSSTCPYRSMSLQPPWVSSPDPLSSPPSSSASWSWLAALASSTRFSPRPRRLSGPGGVFSFPLSQREPALSASFCRPETVGLCVLVCLPSFHTILHDYLLAGNSLHSTCMKFFKTTILFFKVRISLSFPQKNATLPRTVKKNLRFFACCTCQPTAFVNL